MSAVIGLCFVTCAEPYAGVALLVYGLATTLVEFEKKKLSSQFISIKLYLIF